MSTDAITLVLALPTRRDEAWRYAPHRTLGDLSFGPPDGSAHPMPDDLLDALLDTHPASTGLRVVVVNGVLDSGRSRLPGDVSGVTVRSRAATIDPEPPSEEGVSGVPRDAYAELNLRPWVVGAVISVDPGVDVDVPIHIVDITVPDQPGGTSCTRTHVNLGAGSSATIVETRLGAAARFGGSNVTTAVSLDRGAALEHVLVQDLPTSLVHLGRVEVDQAADSRFRARSFNLGATYGRLEYHVALRGSGAVADLAGLFFGSGSQVLDQQITVVHAAGHCVSRQAYRGVLDGESTGVFNGGIDVRRGADGTDATQANDNLLLSSRAEVNTQPRLEILADEVTCTHGATVGRLDDTALYYLRSRGIRAEDARRLLIHGFADQVVDHVGDEPTRTWIRQRLGHDHHA